MNNYIEEEKRRHPYYKIMELNGTELSNELDLWSRQDLIDWLSWNDRNGIYKDDHSLREFGNILGKVEAKKIMTRQIVEE